MNDEILQIYRETFDRIIFGVVAISLVAGGAFLFTSGVASPWVALCGSLLLMAMVALVIRLIGRLVVASYVLVLELIGLVFAITFRSGITPGLAPYFFIPVVVIAGVLLSPMATLIIAAGVAAAMAGLLLVSGQFSLGSVMLTLPALGVTVLVALLAAQNQRNLLLLGNRLVDSRTQLRQRALELMQSLKQVELLESKALQLQKNLDAAQKTATQLQTTVSYENSQLYALVQGTIAELKQSIANLEQSIEKISEMPTLNGHAEIIELAWQKLHHLHTLVVNLEEMVLIGRDEFELSLELVDVAQLVRDVASTARGLAREKKLQIRHHVAEGVSPITADPARLRQVLLQLVSNAIKFTDQGVVEIRAEADQTQVILFVSDTGVGMLADEIDLVFEKFGRSRERAISNRQGPGLGLAISKRLIELHGGRMWASSVPDVGSTFYISLPFKVTQRRLTPAASFSGKTTLRMGANAIAAQPGRVSPAASKNDDGATIIVPPVGQRDDEAIRALLAISTPANPRITQRLTALNTGLVNSARITQPIHRYQPKYIQRFGYILLGLLFLVLLAVAAVAALNYFSGNLPVNLLADSPFTGPALTTEATPTPAQVLITLPTPLSASLPLKATPLPPTSTPPPTATPLPPPSPTAAIVSVASPAAPPATATSLPPTVTPTPSPTPTTTPSPTVTASPTSTPPAATPLLPTSTPTPALVSLASQQAALPLPPSDNSRVSQSASGQMAFASQQASQRDIFVVAPDGAQINLTNSPGDDLQPDWSPDGRQLVFSSGRNGSFNIFSMAADGSNLTRLTDSLGFDEWPVWSPDGRQIAFVSDRDGNVELYVMNADGSNPQRLTNHPADDWPAAWSPDGRSLVFASNRAGNWNLYVTTLSGGQPVRLTAAPGDERDPIWSPDGTTIVFVANAGGNFDVYSLPLPNGLISEVPPERWTQLTATPTDERYPTWTQAR